MRILLALLIVVFCLPWEAFASPEILSFASWKKQRVEQAKMVHDQLLELRRSKLELTHEEELRLRRARMKLLMMEELTATDYLQQYLIRNYPNNFNVLEKAAAKMHPSEMAEIMRAYANLSAQKDEAQAVEPPPSISAPGSTNTR